MSSEESTNKRGTGALFPPHLAWQKGLQVGVIDLIKCLEGVKDSESAEDIYSGLDQAIARLKAKEFILADGSFTSLQMRTAMEKLAERLVGPPSGSHEVQVMITEIIEQVK